MKRNNIKIIWLFVFIVAIFPISSALSGERIELPQGLYYHRFVSSVYGPEATWVNPAGLADYKTISIQYIAELYDSKLSKNWGFNLTGDGIGIGFRQINDVMGEKYKEYIFAIGRELGQVLLCGLSYKYIKEGPAFYNKKHFWNIAFLAVPQSKFSYGATFSNLNRSQVDGQRTDIEQIYSLSYKATKNVLLSSELSLSAGQSLSSAKYNYGIDVYPMEGMTVYANLRDSDGFEIGLRVNLTKYFLGGQSRHGKDNEHIGTSIFAGYVSGKQPSVIKK